MAVINWYGIQSCTRLPLPATQSSCIQEGDEIRQNLAKTAQLVKDNNFLYNRFFAIGLFRLLELSKAKDPQALQGLVSAMGIPQESVNRDLMTYKVSRQPFLYCAVCVYCIDNDMIRGVWAYAHRASPLKHCSCALDVLHVWVFIPGVGYAS